MPYATNAIFTIILPASVFGLRGINHEDKTNTTECWVSQHGKDGFGHQLLGMLTAMGVHGVRAPKDQNTVFHYDAFIPEEFRFQHISNNTEKAALESFLKGALKNFQEQQCHEYACRRFSANYRTNHEIWNLANGKCDDQTTYLVDNVFYGFGKSEGPEMEAASRDIVTNMKKLAQVFAPLLPNHDLPKGRNVVIHIRQGDAKLRGDRPASRVDEVLLTKVSFASQTQRISDALSKLTYDNVIVHSDDVRSARRYITEKSAKFFGKETPLLFVLSQMVNADILITSASSLSLAAGFLQAESTGDLLSLSSGDRALLIPKEDASQAYKLMPRHTTY